MPTKTLPAIGWRDDIEKWAERLKAANLSAETIKTRTRQLCTMSNALLDTPESVTAEKLVHWFASKEWKPETRKGYRAAAVSFFGWLRISGRITDDVTSLLPKVKRPRPHPRPCPDKAIIGALRKANEAETIMLRLAAECGLRRAEIAQVNSHDVIDDLIGKTLIVQGKGDKQRLVPLPDDLAAEILSFSGWVFPGRWSGHVGASYVGKHIAALLPDGWTAHTLRHRYATRLWEETHDLLLVSRLLGHDSVETTQIYVAMPDSELRRGMNAVALAS